MVGVLAGLLAVAAPVRAAPLFGFNEDWLAAGHELAASKPFNPTVQRLHLNWSLIEHTRGVYDWTVSDDMYRDMLRQGAPPIALVMASPCWAAAGSPCPENGLAPAVYPVSPEHYDDWQRFVGKVVRRYRRLAALEVWNEPNLARFYWPVPKVADYVETLKHAYLASKSERPALPVLGGSLASITTRGRVRRDGGFPRVPPSRYPYVYFMREMYGLGAAHYMDALAFHPYPNFAPYLKEKRLGAGVRRGFRTGIRRDLKKQIAMVRRVQRNHEARAPIWVTETGACTTGPRERKVSGSEQAAALREIYLILSRLKVRSIITHRLWDIRVPGTSVNNLENGCGLTDVSGRRKPAWNTLVKLRG